MARPFRGWAVVAGVFVMLLVTAGLGFYGLAVYLRALVVEQGFSVGAVSGATAVFFGVAGLTGLPVASYMARHDPRPLIAGGAVVSGLALGSLGPGRRRCGRSTRCTPSSARASPPRRWCRARRW